MENVNMNNVNKVNKMSVYLSTISDAIQCQDFRLLLNTIFVLIMCQCHMNRTILDIVSSTVMQHVLLCALKEVGTFRREGNDDSIFSVKTDYGRVRM